MHWTGRVRPEAFSIGALTVNWYGIFITAAMLIALAICVGRVRRINVSSDDMLILFLIAVPLAVAFARLGYVVANYEDFFVRPYDWDAFVDTVAIWEGGLTIMWAIPGGVLGGFIWSKIYKKDMIRVADIVMSPILLAQALGRWGNFFNQELYGRTVANPGMQWFPYAVFIAREGEWRQACFFYEMVLNIIGFFILSYVSGHVDIKWLGTISYFTWYCLVRGVMEIYRAEQNAVDARLGANAVMIFAFCVGAIGLIAIASLAIRAARRKEGRIFYKFGIPPLESSPNETVAEDGFGLK